MEEVIVKLYAEVLLAVLFTTGYLVLLVQKRQWIHLGKVAPSKRQSLRKIEKRVDCVVKVVGGICVIVMVVWRVIPGILDFPNAMAGNYEHTTGEVVVWDYSRETRKQARSIEVLDSHTNEKVHVIVYSTGVHKEEHLKITYLKNSRFGIIEERW